MVRRAGAVNHAAISVGIARDCQRRMDRLQRRHLPLRTIGVAVGAAEALQPGRAERGGST